MIQLYPALFATVGIGAVTVAVLFSKIVSTTVDNLKAKKIADAIAQGAMTFLKEEYKVIAVAITRIAVVLGYVFGGGSGYGWWIINCFRASFKICWCSSSVS